MKKLLFTLFTVMSLSISAQGSLSAGATFGLPTGDASNLTTFALGGDVNYMFASDSDFSYGIASGFLTYFGDEITTGGITVELDNASFIPLAGALRYGLSDKFSVGGDVGYAIGASDGNDGGFYFRPMVIYGVSEKVSLNLSYSGVSNDGTTLSNIGLGVMFGL